MATLSSKTVTLISGTTGWTDCRGDNSVTYLAYSLTVLRSALSTCSMATLSSKTVTLISGTAGLTDCRGGNSDGSSDFFSACSTPSAPESIWNTGYLYSWTMLCLWRIDQRFYLKLAECSNQSRYIKLTSTKTLSFIHTCTSERSNEFLATI